MTPEEIQRLDELHAKTTPGEWFHVSETPDRQEFCDQPPTQHAVSIDGFDTPDIVAFTGDEIDAEDDAVCIAEMHNAWPAISAELKELERVRELYVAESAERRKFETALNATEERASELARELTRLREFEADVREAMAGAKHDYERVGEVSIAIDDLERKRGEHEPT